MRKFTAIATILLAAASAYGNDLHHKHHHTHANSEWPDIKTSTTFNASVNFGTWDGSNFKPYYLYS